MSHTFYYDRKVLEVNTNLRKVETQNKITTTGNFIYKVTPTFSENSRVRFEMYRTREILQLDRSIE